MDIGRTIDTEITQEMKRAYLDYAMSVIVARALPDVRDGLKPVHRRILFAMLRMGLTHQAKYAKSVKIVGETMGKYHPHGDMAVYDTLVRLAQNFSMRYPLVDGQGNFGSVDGDSPAAMRYTEARLTKLAEVLLEDIDKETVDFRDNFDASFKEPVYLPAKLPNLLLMGSDGIAVGMATKIPPHNLNEVVQALVYMIDKGTISFPLDQGQKTDFKKINFNDDPAKYALSAGFDSGTSIEELMEFIKGPDFPTGAAIYGKQNIIQAYTTGNGKILIRGQAEISEDKRGRFQIIISSLPYQVNKAALVTKIADLVKNHRIDGVANLRDESDRHGMRIAIDLKKTCRPKTILANLYKYTTLQTTYPVNMVILVNGVPELLTLKQILVEFTRHRQQVVTKRIIFDLTAARARAHILEGFKIALDNLDAVIETIKKSADADAAKTNLMTRFKLSEIQATAILDLQLRRLAALERKKIEDEYKAVMAQIQYLTDLLLNPKKILDLVSKELKELSEKYGDDRRTKVYQAGVKEFADEDLIPQEKCLIALTTGGYIKRLPVSSYKPQHRGGKGVSGMTTKESDEIMNFLISETHDNILLFTNKGRVFSIRTWDIPEGGRLAKGQAIINLVNVGPEESIQAILNLKQNLAASIGKYLFMVTKRGVVKKTAVESFRNIRSTGLIAIKLDKGDELRWVKLTTGKDHVLLVSHQGKSIHFQEGDTRSMGRDTRGVRGIYLKKDDFVVGMEIFPLELPEKIKGSHRQPFRDVLVVTQNGLGKRTRIGEYSLQKRGGIGIKAAAISNKTGPIVASQIVTNFTRQVIITSKRAQVIRLPLKNIPRHGRDTQGVILMRFGKPGDSVAAVTALLFHENSHELGEVVYS